MNKKARIISMLLAIQMIFMAAATGAAALDDAAVLSQDQAATEIELAVDDDAAATEDQAAPAGIAEEAEQNEAVLTDAETGEEVSEDAAAAAETSAGIEEASGVTISVKVSATTAVVTIGGKEASKVARIVAVKDGTEAESGVPGSDGTFTVNGLTKGSKYSFRAVDAAGVILAESETVTITGELAAPTGVIAAPGHKSVTVYWDKVEGATGYEVYRNGKLLKKVGENKTSYRDKTVKEGPSGNTGKVNQYKYYVIAVSDSDRSPKSATKTAGKVRSALYEITFKSSAKLTSHDKYKKTITFKGGQTVYADGFAQGKYQFSYKKGSKTYRFYTMWMRIKNPKGHIKKNAYQNGHTAENYVNEGNYSSPTKWLIWVNIYSQRVFVYKGSKGKWKLVKDWQCGTGTPKTPTSSGMNKKLHKKQKHYSKHKWWNMFSGTMAIHGSNGAKEEAKLGKLISNGCVRVTNDQAKWIYDEVDKGTRVLIY